MDNSYSNVVPAAQKPDASTHEGAEIDDPQLPTRAIQAIRHSLDYWSRSIQWLKMQKVQNEMRTKDNSKGNQPILTVDLARSLRVALIQQSDIWHSLMTYEQNLSNFTAEYVTLNILNDFMGKLEEAMKKRAQADVPVFVGIGVFAVLFLVVAGISVYTQSSATQPALIAFIVAALAAGGRAVMSWVTKLRGIFGSSGQAITDTLQRGYQQLLVEFGDLNYNVAISFALASFFIEDMNWFWQQPSNIQNAVKDAYSFLTQIIWTAQDREDEITRVAVAAFGPLGALVVEQTSQPSAKGRPGWPVVAHVS
jgi:hypothetical protein